MCFLRHISFLEIWKRLSHAPLDRCPCLLPTAADFATTTHHLFPPPRPLNVATTTRSPLHLVRSNHHRSPPPHLPSSSAPPTDPPLSTSTLPPLLLVWFTHHPPPDPPPTTHHLSFSPNFHPRAITPIVGGNPRKCMLTHSSVDPKHSFTEPVDLAVSLADPVDLALFDPAEIVFAKAPPGSGFLLHFFRTTPTRFCFFTGLVTLF